ncbi:hypothetical protein D3C81_2048950 [compost metagenome]
MGQIVHRDPGFLAVGAITVAEHDRFGRALGRNVPALHDAAAVQRRKGDVLIIQSFGQ